MAPGAAAAAARTAPRTYQVWHIHIHVAVPAQKARPFRLLLLLQAGARHRDGWQS